VLGEPKLSNFKIEELKLQKIENRGIKTAIKLKWATYFFSTNIILLRFHCLLPTEVINTRRIYNMDTSKKKTISEVIFSLFKTMSTQKTNETIKPESCRFQFPTRY
jgi:hypothetical protein